MQRVPPSTRALRRGFWMRHAQASRSESYVPCDASRPRPNHAPCVALRPESARHTAGSRLSESGQSDMPSSAASSFFDFCRFEGGGCDEPAACCCCCCCA